MKYVRSDNSDFIIEISLLNIKSPFLLFNSQWEYYISKEWNVVRLLCERRKDKPLSGAPMSHRSFITAAKSQTHHGTLLHWGDKRGLMCFYSLKFYKQIPSEMYEAFWIFNLVH